MTYHITQNEKIVHRHLPTLDAAKTILRDMELYTLATGHIVESYELAFRAAGNTFMVQEASSRLIG